jgi:UDP-glucose 4-epimerase
MRVLVTGGAGYIGSVIVEQLLHDGHQPMVFDDLSKGHAESVAGAPLVIGNILDGNLLRETLREGAIEAVIHMAADSLVGESVTDPSKYYRTNLSGGLQVLDAMRVTGVGRIVFSSTAAVYGEPAKQPIEEGDPTRPTNPYGATKLAFEQALAAYGTAYRLRSACLRYFNAAGASTEHGERHDPETHLIPIVLEVAAGLRDEIVIYGHDYPTADGTCIRDYIHVVDLARAHVLALEALDQGNRIYNLGCGGGFSVREVIEVARAVTGHPIPERMGPRRPGDPAVLIASSERIRHELGWAPSMQDLATIIGSAWRWMEMRVKR